MDQQGKNNPSNVSNMKKTFGAIALFILVLSISIFIIQLISIATDALRNKLGVPTQYNKEDQSSTTLENTQAILDIKKSLSPYEYKEKLLKSNIILNFQNTSVNNKPSKVFEKQLSIKGKFKSGFLYIKASANGSALTKDDGIYVKLGGMISKNYVELGGHIIKNKTLETPQSKQFTELLFDLTNVNYKDSYNDPDIKVISGNWLDLLNSGNTRLVTSFSSTEMKGNIEELSLYYECDNSDCSIN